MVGYYNTLTFMEKENHLCIYVYTKNVPDRSISVSMTYADYMIMSKCSDYTVLPVSKIGKLNQMVFNLQKKSLLCKTLTLMYSTECNPKRTDHH